MSLDQGNRRAMNTIVELSPEQAQTSPEEIDFSRDSGGVSLSPLAQGKKTFVRLKRKKERRRIEFV